MNKMNLLKYNVLVWHDLFVTVTYSLFDNEQNAPEVHAMFQIQNNSLTVEEQFGALASAVKRLLQSEYLSNCRPVMMRYFVSDAVNQAKFMPTQADVAVSIVQQPPLNGAKVCLWAYLVGNGHICSSGDNTVILQRPNYKHIYTAGLLHGGYDETRETELIFEQYKARLNSLHCSLKDNCIRTWIYVQGVDLHYKGMVVARKRCFEDSMSPNATHYIASTGIEGKSICPEALILMDAYSISGVCPEQISYLKGLTHLNPTIEYGVTFERATAVDYGDRRHIYISGTASIDNRGAVVAPLQIQKQLDRVLENIQVLLKEGAASMHDIVQMIVYLRDTADYEIVNYTINSLCPDVPKVVVWAPVCRPEWLVEIECMAVTGMSNTQFACY
jgi:enamine deaminase RidA (YjgF/YER057c/UK114 family)